MRPNAETAEFITDAQELLDGCDDCDECPPKLRKTCVEFWDRQVSRPLVITAEVGSALWRKLHLIVNARKEGQTSVQIRTVRRKKSSRNPLSSRWN